MAKSYRYVVVGGSGRVVASFPTRQQAKDYARLHPAYRVRRVNG